MDDKDENTKNIIENQQDDSEADEAKTIDELIKKKADNEFNVSENTAHTQIYLQNAYFNGGTDIKQVLDLVNVNMGSEKKYNLRKEEDCAEFFSTCKNREYLTLAIILSVFEIVAIGDIANLKNVLEEYLPSIVQLDNEGKEKHILKSDPYLSLNTVLSVIGGKVFIRGEDQQCIGYGNDSDKILSNIWIQFPVLREPIILWLLKVNDSFEYRTTFEAYQITTAFIRVMSEDFLYSQKHIFERLYSKSCNLGLLARLAQELLAKEKIRNDIFLMILKWTRSDSEWLWKAALLVHLNSYDPSIDNELKKALIITISKRFFSLERSDLRFITTFATYSENVRLAITSVYHSLYIDSDVYGKRKLAQIYIQMIRYGYYKVKRNLINLPLVVCDSKEQISNIEAVLVYIMSQYDLRCQLYFILRAYIEEITLYNVPPNINNRLTAYFYALTKKEYDYQEDILLFLKESDGNLANDVYNHLTKIYKGMGGIR